jgi:hypothetical protein
MPLNVKLNTVFRDRIDIAAEVSALVADSGLNISSAEVEPVTLG